MVQVKFLVITALIAAEFVAFYEQVLAGGPVTALRPAGVEAYLPLGSLLAVRRWLETGLWDEIHPAGMTFLLAVLGGAVLARRAFCGWICPFGFLSRVLEWFRSRLLRLPDRWAGPRWLRDLAAAPKYLLLGVIAWSLGTLPLAGVNGFMYLPYNLAADANMLRYVLSMGATGVIVIASLVAVSTVVRNAWCRSLCPYGALVGLAGAAAPLRVVRDPAACRNCGACSDACGMGIRVADASSVRSLDCTSCLACIGACQVPGALAVRTPWGTRIRPWVVPVLALGVLAAAYVVAHATGFWETTLTVEDFRRAYALGLKAR